jgi:drug/metabolite transporter (DMT)-like permease
MSELAGVAAALLSSLLGGTAVAATRYAIGTIDPLTLAMLRYGIGALCLSPVAIYALRSLKTRSDIVATIGLGMLFFALFPYLFTLSLAHTTAARGSLALSSLPLLTLGLGILLGREAFSWPRLLGILLAVGGLGYALSPRLGGSALVPFRGDLIMVAAACVGATFNVLSRPYILRIGALSFTALGMCVGAACLAVIWGLAGVFHRLPALHASAWLAVAYLGVAGCALTFLLWSIGIRLASPALVALTVTVNPITASFLASFYLGEPITQELVAGLCAVLLGIAIATNLLSVLRIAWVRVRP